ncbi:glycosyl hydrolase [Paenibacillus periandrae]|uniref:glycosyl hydrolase n=1 Tax=Paenibacillus periandrae TaxID=1761741 RepID=UPI001F093E71|nr:glycosyl hydrolase [Paenibacillus periandrae]
MLNKWISKWLAVTLMVTLLASGSQWIGGTKASAATPVNPNATQAVIDVLNYFDTVHANNQIISGQYVRGQNYGYMETDHIYNLTSGKYPAMIGFDFYYNVTNASDLSNWRSFIVDHATDYWKKGGLVTISWHQTNPLDATADSGGWNSVISSMSQTDFNSLTTPGTPLYNKWLAHIDTMAGYLKSLRDQGVVVLWRPYHEMNIGFWWGGKTGASYKKLWENMYDRYTNYHGLNNLIWVWAPARDDNNAINSNYYPGSSYVDLGGADVYVQNRSDGKFGYANSELTSVMGSKRYGLSEVGLLPTETAVQTTFDYTWFLVWAIGWADNLFYGYPSANGPGNNTYSITPFYSNAMTITRDEVPSFGRTIVGETIIFKDAMNGYSAAGVSPSNWTTVATGGTVTVENVPTVGLGNGPDRSMKINKTSTTNAATAEKTFTPQTGVVTFKATLRTEDASWKDFIIYDSTSKAALHAGIQGNYLKVYDGATLMSIEPITNSKWYDIKVIMNTSTQKFDLYVNGAKKANQFSFKNTAAVDVSRLKVGVATDATGTYYIDNVFITK